MNTVGTEPEPRSEGSEYVRWVQSTLNQVLNLQLPVHGILDVPTRSAIRSFQEKNGLPVTGITGPDTERALMGARDGQAAGAGATKQGEPGTAEPSQPAATSFEPEPSTSPEPAPASPSAEFEFESDEDTFGDLFGRVSSGIGDVLGWFTGANLTPIEDRTAITLRKGYGNLRYRRYTKVWALVLHHTAGNLKENPEDLDHVNAHFVITPMGRILKLHPIESLLWASHGISPASVAVEFVGSFRNERHKCWFPKKILLPCSQPPTERQKKTYFNRNGECGYLGGEMRPCDNTPTPQQIKAGRDLVRHLIQNIGLTTILVHRQSSKDREGDPGPDIWYHVGQWAVDNLGLSDGGPGFRHGDGYPIPDSWRNWGRTANQPELSAQPFQQRPPIQQQEEIDPERPEHTEWLQRSLNHVLRLRLPEDGVLGPATRSALRSFQRQRKLDASGVLNVPTERSLMAAGATPHRHPAQGERFEFEALSSQPLLRRGSTGAAVVDLQKRLATFGFSPGAADGIFGSLTEAAVKNFQRSRGLSADGIVGAQTWGTLSGSTGAPSVSPGYGTPATPLSVNTPLPASGKGFKSYTSADKRYGTAATIRAVQAIGAAWNQAHPSGPRLGIGNISRQGGGEFPPHSTHREGLNVDIRPVRSDRKEDPVRYTDNLYSRSLTQELVNLIYANPVIGVSSILFNDTGIQGVKPYKGHDDHLHVTFKASA